MGVAFALFSQPHHVDFVCASCPTVGRLPPSENKMSNARGVGGGGGGMNRLGIGRGINWSNLNKPNGKVSRNTYCKCWRSEIEV